jgi:hypothetical protein
MSYTEHLLSSSSSLKKKEVLIYLDGGKIEGSGSSFLESFMAVIVALEHGTCLCLILQLGNMLVSESYQFHVSSYFFISSRRVLLFSITLCSWYSSSQCFQVTCHASSCSREVSLQTIHLQYYQFPFPVSVHTHLIHHLTSLSCVSFMSMMGDTSWPSFDESFPVDFNTLSRN